MTPPGTTLRAIRIPQDLWDAATEKARRLDTSVSEKVRDMLQAWVDEDDSDGAMMLGSGEVHRSATTP